MLLNSLCRPRRRSDGEDRDGNHPKRSLVISLEATASWNVAVAVSHSTFLALVGICEEKDESARVEPLKRCCWHDIHASILWSSAVIIRKHGTIRFLILLKVIKYYFKYLFTLCSAMCSRGERNTQTNISAPLSRDRTCVTSFKQQRAQSFAGSLPGCRRPFRIVRTWQSVHSSAWTGCRGSLCPAARRGVSSFARGSMAGSDGGCCWSARGRRWGRWPQPEERGGCGSLPEEGRRTQETWSAVSCVRCSSADLHLETSTGIVMIIDQSLVDSLMKDEKRSIDENNNQQMNWHQNAVLIYLRRSCLLFSF